MRRTKRMMHVWNATHPDFASQNGSSVRCEVRFP